MLSAVRVSILGQTVLFHAQRVSKKSFVGVNIIAGQSDSFSRLERTLTQVNKINFAPEMRVRHRRRDFSSLTKIMLLPVQFYLQSGEAFFVPAVISPYKFYSNSVSKSIESTIVKNRILLAHAHISRLRSA